MTEFQDIHWLKVISAFDKHARLIRWLPDRVEFAIHPYGNIEVFDNGGEVNVFWHHVPNLELNLPEYTLKTWQFTLNYSISLHGKPEKLGKELRAALDDAIELAIKQQPILYLPIATHRPEEVRVIRQGSEFVIQTRKPGKLWVIYQNWTELDIAVMNAIALYDSAEK